MKTENKNTKHRFYEIVQYEFNPKTKESLSFDELNIIQGLNHKTIKAYGWVCHDKDVFTQYDYDEGNCTEEQIGSPKGKHWHCVIDVQPKLALHTVAEWFGVPDNQVAIKKGQNALIDCIEYFTHEREEEQAKGKYLYPDKKITSNINFREKINAKNYNKKKYGKSELKQIEEWKLALKDGIKNLKQIEDENPLLFINNLTELQKVRKFYIEKKKPFPKFKCNFYISGDSGAGKTLASRQLARALVYQSFPELTEDEDIFFTVGESGNRFDGYDGQPVIIWNDCRALTLLDKLGGKEGFFELFDPHPDKKAYNIKYGSVRLTNTFNIVNSVEPYEDFLNTLCGEYRMLNGTIAKAETKIQSYRRFPFIIPVTKDHLEFLSNKGVFGEGTFFEYRFISKVRNKCVESEKRYDGNNPVLRSVNNQLFQIPVKKYNELREKEYPLNTSTDEDDEKMFLEYGVPVEDNDPTKIDIPCIDSPLLEDDNIIEADFKEIKEIANKQEEPKIENPKTEEPKPEESKKEESEKTNLSKKYIPQEKIFITDDSKIINGKINLKTGKIEKLYLDEDGIKHTLWRDKQSGKYYYNKSVQKSS